MLSKTIATVNDEIGLLIKAKYPIIYIVSYEERRVQQQLRLIRQSVIEKDLEKKRQQKLPERELKKWEETGRLLYYWSCTQGFQVLVKRERPVDSDGQPATYEQLEVVEARGDPAAALQWLLKKETGIFVFQDLHPFITQGSIGYSPSIVRGLRDVAAHFRRASSSTLILLSPILVTPPEVEKEIVVVDYPLPTADELEEKLSQFEPGIKKQYGPESVAFLTHERREFMQKAIGLTYEEVENVWARALERDGKLGYHNIDEIIEEKRQAIQKSGLLEYYPAVEKFDKVGGLDGLKSWLRQRKDSFWGVNTERSYKLPIPKGILLIGIPGCGKSLSAKAVAAEWRVPLVRLDVGRLYNSMLGKTEENFRNAIKVVEQLAPVILWVDEVEKGFPQSTGSGDSGVSTRVLGFFLNWMQEKETPVFVVATANNIEAMPPELTRKGRFDEIFYVGLPAPKEREEIFAIHLKRWGLILDTEEIKRLAEKAENFTGAEIEQVVESSLWSLSVASESDELPQKEVITGMLEAEIGELRPIAQRLEDNRGYQEMHRRAKQIAKSASGQERESFPQSVEHEDWRYQQRF